MYKATSKFPSTFLGVLFGFLFFTLGLSVDLIYRDLGHRFGNVAELFIQNPLHWIALSAPLMFGTIFYFFNGLLSRKQNEVEDVQKKNEGQITRLESFIAEIEQGNFSNDSCDFDNQRLTSLLGSLKQKLKFQKEEDEKGRWVAEGHAKFGEILRGSDNMEKLADEVIKNLVQYVGLNQGSLFLLDGEGETQELVLKACYAYQRKKYLTKTIEPGEGLVGQVYLENTTTVLTAVPKDYIKITSGLGEATPTFVVIIPIKSVESTEGVIELAGFTKLEPFQIRFIEKVCEGLATVFRTVKVAEQTKNLLHASQTQTEQLRLQEEEIRQNLEEMHATQEQLARQLEESRRLQERVERRERVMALTTILSETDIHGTITFVNDKFCEVSKYTREELIGKAQNIVRHPDMPAALFKIFWATIKAGKVFTGIVKNRSKDGSHYWVEATIVPIMDEKGEILKYVGSRYHIKDDALGKVLYNRQAKKFGWPGLIELEEYETA